MAIATTEVAAGDGRTLTVYDAGDPDGAPILFHHGTPSSGRPYERHVRVASEQGVRLFSYDRAGYAASSRNAGRSVADVAGDVEAIANALGIGRFATWGLSGGGPHALACAALLGDRVAAAASVAGVAPADAAGLDWLAGMGESNVQEFAATRAGEATLRPALEREAAGFAGFDVAQLLEQLRSLLCAEDVEALSGELGAYLLESFQAGVSRGVDGWADDDLAFDAPWGFELAELAVPVLVVHGQEDMMAPPGHGAWLADHVPGAEAWLLEREGHLTLLADRAVGRLHDWLLARL